MQQKSVQKSTLDLISIDPKYWGQPHNLFLMILCLLCTFLRPEFHCCLPKRRRAFLTSVWELIWGPQWWKDMAEIGHEHRSKDSGQNGRRVNDTDRATTGSSRHHQTTYKESSKRADSYEHHGHQRRAYGSRDGYRECNDPGTAVYQYQNTGRTLCLKAGHDISIIAHTRVRLNDAYPKVVSMGSNDTASSPALVWSEACDPWQACSITNSLYKLCGFCNKFS